MSLTHDAILAFLDAELGLDLTDVDLDTPLLSSSRVDSFSLVDLLGWLEERTGRTLDPMDVTLENFDSVRRMIAFLAS